MAMLLFNTDALLRETRSANTRAKKAIKQGERYIARYAQLRMSRWETLAA